MNRKLDAVILASGFFGRMKEFKPLYSFGDGTLIEHFLQLLRPLGFREIIVVTGHQADRLREHLDGTGCRVVYDDFFHLGFYRSVQAGVASLRGDNEGFILLPVDIPLVRPETVVQLLENFSTGDADVLFPSFGESRGYPPVISSNLKSYLLDWHGQGALKGALDDFAVRHPKRVQTLAVADEGVLLSMDTDSDYRKLRQRLARQGLPTLRECQEILHLAKTPQWATRHGQVVAAVALGIGKAMNVGRNGNSLDLEQIERAALVHDLAKGLPRHEMEGGRILLKMGFNQIANIVAAHEDLLLSDTAPISEWEVVYMANKLINGINPVTLDEYFQEMLERYPDDENARGQLVSRMENARIVQKRIESEIGFSLYDLVANILEN